MSPRIVAASVALAVAASFVVAQPAQAEDRKVTATVHHWSDGDTVVTNLGKIRLIGINAPDKGECGYRAATRLAKKLAPAGSAIKISDPGSVSNTDDYGRFLRYVSASGVDVGLKQIKKGSQAKFDSTDGYEAHPKQARYRKQDTKHADYCGNADLASHAPVSGNACPSNAPIKGNRGDDEWIYHLPSNKYYSVTNPEECFASEDGAKEAGYRAALV